MWSFEHTVVATGASREQVWAVWADLENWPAWDAGLEWCRPDRPGPPGVGATYTLKPRGGPEVQATFTRVEAGRGFTDVTRLPMCRLTFDHAVDDVPGGVRVTHRATFTGPAAFLFRRVIGSRIARELPGTLGRLVASATATKAPGATSGSAA